MPDDLQVVYWDANVFLSYLNAIPHRLPDLDALLEQSGQQFQIVTSTVSIVEVAFAATEQAAGVLDPAIEQRIAALWAPDSPIKLVEFSGLVAEIARDLVRLAMTRGTGMKPLDAIHLATAKAVATLRFHTYDEHLYQYAELVGFSIEPPQASAPKLL